MRGKGRLMPKQKAEPQKALLARDLQLVYGLALFCTGGPVCAQAVCQKVFVDYGKRDLSFFREEGRKSWLLRRTIRICRKNLIGRKPETDLRKTCFSKKEENMVFLSLCRFPFRHRVLLYLSLFAGMSCEEIGKALHKREELVREELVQGRKKLYHLFSSLSVPAQDGKSSLDAMRRQMAPPPQFEEEIFQRM